MKNIADKKDTIRPLVLFKNRLGKVVGVENLYPDPQNPWLGAFSIDPEEENPLIAGYVSSTEKEIYHNIILAQWKEIVTQEKVFSRDNVSEFYEFIRELYSYNKGDQTLEQGPFIYCQNQFIEDSEEVFFHPELEHLPDRDYELVIEAFKTLFNYSVPAKNLLGYFREVPFKLSPKSLAPDRLIELNQTSQMVVKAVLSAFMLLEYPFL